LNKVTMKNLWILLVVVFFTIISCDKSSTPTPTPTNTNFKIIFNGNYDGNDLVMGKSYPFVDTFNISFFTASLILTDIKLVNDQNDTIKLSDASFVNLSKESSTAAKNGDTLSFNNILKGNYKSISFNLGVSPDANSKYPSEYTKAPLSEEENYWLAWKSFIFTKTEGSLLNYSSKYLSPFVYHTGGNAALRKFTFNKSFTISDNSILKFNVNYKKVLFDKNGVPLDVLNNQSSHKPGDEPINNFLMDNFQNALTIQ